jgi:polyisoprenoid-binding protein YceI
MNNLKRSRLFVFILLLQLIISSFSVKSQLYITRNGKVNFVSEAPLEIIKAASSKLTGILNTSDKSFVFSVSMKTFNGFNSPLQKIHFNENYIESNKYPNAKFKGKIIEDIDLKKPGNYKVRAKGKFSVHGKENPMTIRCTITISKGEIKVNSNFVVYLKDHNIQIPTIVNQKLSEKINVSIKTSLKQKK